MRKSYLTFFILCISLVCVDAQPCIRVNHLGYLPEDDKIAVFLATRDCSVASFRVVESKTGLTCLTGRAVEAPASRWALAKAYRLDFSALEREGAYYIEAGGVRSPAFRIGAEVYAGTADFILNYMRQQRCGDNPFLNDSCHTRDAYIVLHPTREGEKIDVKGGWHDAADYLQYLPTSANAVYQMLFAYYKAPDKSVFGDCCDRTGREGANGIPDILDEARWGLEWLLKMNPEPGVMFNQIADDRDHVGFRLPTVDKADYGWGEDGGRPVYYITGRPQGLGKYRNRTTGVASSAGKFASAFGLGYLVFADSDPRFAGILRRKALPAYAFAEKYPGNTQTCCTVSPYFYEEDNYVDDIELAAATFALDPAAFRQGTDAPDWIGKACYWGRLEPVTPWMETARARHYQWYPFVNLGHYLIASLAGGKLSGEYIAYMKQGLEHIYRRGLECPFLNGVPFVWCSNNLVVAALTEAHLYRELTGDMRYAKMEASLRDWLFGCNPWGTSMIVELPKGSDYPRQPHSSYVRILGVNTAGGLVDGPLDALQHASQHHLPAGGVDEYEAYNRGVAVYHDGIWDYATNEPTMDGTASLSYYLSQKECEGRQWSAGNTPSLAAVRRNRRGCITRMDPGRKTVYFVFAADSLFNGGETVLKALRKHRAKASFFVTGNCLRMEIWKDLIADIIEQGHYLGPHGDRHLLYAPWTGDREQSLVTPDSLARDINDNLRELSRIGVDLNTVNWFLPSYEHYNCEVARVSAKQGLQLIGMTPGIGTPADYIPPGQKGYKSSLELMRQLLEYEEQHTLNGAVVLIHPGVVAGRTDCLFDRLDRILKILKAKGYKMDRLP